MNDDEYRGPAVLTFGRARHPVEIRMSAHFEPTEGRMRWAGRTAPDPLLLRETTSGLREAELSIEGSPPAGVRLSEPDPWGGIRLTGTGTPPWFR
ncbi:DUF4873 domain-containing protein [Actinoplanes sp. M2I2]|uniref:DUF4873 domain-containing protein n=1 Tax=Actinoplanes sp. M2I2 TaxID=1734444 RepID=UPI0020204050|nr:DUF4873 domain-containing protein [Actinoplanes sp. M2I2]